MSGEFYSEDLGVSAHQGIMIADFMMIAHNERAVKAARPWAKEGLARVYIEIWSQNSLNPVEQLTKCYYDADLDDVFFIRSYCGTDSRETLGQIANKRSAGIFSGAKTRQAIKDFAEAFYG